MNESFDTLIRRFIDNKCSAEEAEKVLDILENYPELLEKYLGQSEFESIASGNFHLPARVKTRIKAEVFKNIDKPATGRIFFKALAAACVIGFFIALFFIRNDKERVLPQLSGELAQTIDGSFINQFEKTITNTGTEAMHVQLPDGSTVILRPKAEVKYLSSFTKARNIYLKGDAYFKVSKDAQHPFKVHEGGVGITALGTEFWVCNQTNENIISVKLVEGKVLVSPVSADFTFKDVVLYPNQDFIVNKIAGTTALHDNSMQKRIAQETGTLNQIKKEAAVVNINEYALQFSYTPVTDVFAILENYFNVKIVVDKAILSNSQFTGKIYLKDSIETIIRKISELNNLQFMLKRSPENDTIFMKQKSLVSDPPAARQSSVQPFIKNNLYTTPAVKVSGTADTKFKKEIFVNKEYIEFRYATIQEVFGELKKYHQIQIQMEEGISQNLFTGKIYHNLPVDKSIKHLCKINDLQYSVIAERFLIYK